MTSTEKTETPLSGTAAYRATRNALLNAIANEVGSIDSSASQDQRIARVKHLAEAYSLVVHSGGSSLT